MTVGIASLLGARSEHFLGDGFEAGNQDGCRVLRQREQHVTLTGKMLSSLHETNVG